MLYMTYTYTYTHTHTHTHSHSHTHTHTHTHTYTHTHTPPSAAGPLSLIIPSSSLGANIKRPSCSAIWYGAHLIRRVKVRMW
jgi:ABC-type Zn2+ transport system substrate-binding protein/surface adhesin